MRRVFGFLVAASLPVMGCAPAPNGAEPLGILSHGSEGGVAERNNVAFRPAGSQIWQPLHDGGGNRRGGVRDGGYGGRSGRDGFRDSGFGRRGDRDGRFHDKGFRDKGFGRGFDDFGYFDGPFIDAVAIGVPWLGGFGLPWPNLINAPLLYGGLGYGGLVDPLLAYGGLGLGGYGAWGAPYGGVANVQAPPIVNQPMVQSQPMIQQPMIQQPMLQQPLMQPMLQQPVLQQPLY